MSLGPGLAAAVVVQGSIFIKWEETAESTAADHSVSNPEL